MNKYEWRVFANNSWQVEGPEHQTVARAEGTDQAVSFVEAHNAVVRQLIEQHDRTITVCEAVLHQLERGEASECDERDIRFCVNALKSAIARESVDLTKAPGAEYCRCGHHRTGHLPEYKSCNSPLCRCKQYEEA